MKQRGRIFQDTSSGKGNIKQLVAAGLITTLSIFGITPAAAGEYDGIWTSPTLPDHYFMVYQSGSNLVVSDLIVNTGGTRWWDAYMGPLNNNIATISTLASDVSLDATITFSSPTTGVFKVNSCTPVYSPCRTPTGSQANIQRLM